MSTQFVTFGDLVRLQFYHQNGQFAGFLSGNRNQNAVIDDNRTNALVMCVAPFGFFAEDEEMKGRSLNSAPFILQQLTWHPGSIIAGDRNVMIARDSGVMLRNIDISNRDDVMTMLKVYSTEKPQIENNPRYGEKYYMSIGENQKFFIGTQYPYIRLGSSPGYLVSFEFAGSLEPSRNFPFSQSHQPYGSLQGMCTKCHKCTR